MLQEVRAYIEVTGDFLTEQSVVGHESESHGVPGRGSVYGVGACPVAVKVTHGHRGHHGHSLHDYAVRAVVAGDGLVGAGVGERATYFEPFCEVVVDIESAVESGEVRADDCTLLFHPAAAHRVDGLFITAGHAELVVLHECCAEYLVLPVGAFAQE